MLRCPFRSWPTNALRQTLNKYLFPLFIPYSNVRIVYSFFPVSLLLFVDTHEETHTHTHISPPFLFPRVVYREYKLDFGIIVGGSPIVVERFRYERFPGCVRNVAAFTRPRDNTTAAAVSYPFRLKKLLRCLPHSSPTPPTHFYRDAFLCRGRGEIKVFVSRGRNFVVL